MRASPATSGGHGLGYGLTRPGCCTDSQLGCSSASHTRTVGAIALSDGKPSMPWLPIPEADGFKWEAIFIATVLCWVLAAGVMHLLSKLFHGNGSFEAAPSSW